MFFLWVLKTRNKISLLCYTSSNVNRSFTTKTKYFASDLSVFTLIVGSRYAVDNVSDNQLHNSIWIERTCGHMIIT